MAKKQNLKQEIEKLRSDDFYYGDGGKKYLSNSDIKILFQEPAQFRLPVLENENLARGKLFHQLLLEPKKAKTFRLLMEALGTLLIDSFSRRMT